MKDIPDEDKVLVELENSGDKMIEYVGLILSLPLYYKSLTVTGYDFPVNYNIDSGYHNILIPFLHPRQKIIFNIEYKE